MTRVHLVFVSVVALLLRTATTLGLQPPQEDRQNDTEELSPLNGVWIVTSATIDRGKTTFKRPEHQWVIEGDRIAVAKGNLERFKNTSVGERISDALGYDASFKLDPSQQPPTIDLELSAGPDQGKTLQGIYALDGDILKICVALSGDDRPRNFDAVRREGGWLITFKRSDQLAHITPPERNAKDRDTARDKKKESSEAENENDPLQGTWDVVDSKIGGKAQLPGRGPKAAKFKAGSLTMDLPRGPRVFQFTVDTTMTPSHINLMTPRDGKLEVLAGIFQLDNDDLLLCMPLDARGARPDAFETDGEQWHLLTLKRRRTEAAAEDAPAGPQQESADAPASAELKLPPPLDSISYDLRPLTDNFEVVQCKYYAKDEFEVGGRVVAEESLVWTLKATRALKGDEVFHLLHPNPFPNAFAIVGFQKVVDGEPVSADARPDGYRLIRDFRWIDVKRAPDLAVGEELQVWIHLGKEGSAGLLANEATKMMIAVQEK